MSKSLRLGISSSAFIHIMPREVEERRLSYTLTGSPTGLDDRANKLMVDFTRDMMRSIVRAGIGTMELYHSPIWDAERVLEPMLEIDAVEFWSVHAPYGKPCDPSSPDPEIRDAAVQACCGAVDVARMLGAKMVVAHPGSDTPYQMTRQDRLRMVPDTLKRIANYAGERGIRIAVEPVPRDEPGNTLDQVMWVVEQIGMPNVGVNFDVNHLYPAAAIPGLIREAGELILSVHISDQDDTERHWLPFRGKIDWGETLESLLAVGYSGPLIYETHIDDAVNCDEVAHMVMENYGRLMDSVTALPNEFSRAEASRCQNQTQEALP